MWNFNRARSLILLVLFAAQPALGHWQLYNDHSRLSFVSIKAGNVAEVHHFKTLAGAIDDEGGLTLTIDLTSVDTLIPIRDERMRNILFKTADFPNAAVSAKLDMEKLKAIPIGGSNVIDVAGQVTISGQTAPVNGSILVTRTGHRQVQAVTLAPIVLNAGSFGLTAGVEQLRQIAGLPSISLAVPVTFALTFRG